MKYSVRYKNTFEYINEVDEVEIFYYREKGSMIANFLKLHFNKIVVINIDKEPEFDKFDFKIFKSLIEDRIDNFVLKFSLSKKDIYDMVRDTEIKFMFSDYIRDWDTLRGIAEEYKPREIYIVESLAFDIIEISKYLHSLGIRVRVIPNIAQSSWNNSDSLKKFFIRPEDVVLYEDYVDTMELLGGFNEQSIETFYKIYAKDKKWFGKLNELILDFDKDDNIDNRTILPEFGYRIRCKKKCVAGGACRICDSIREAANFYSNNNMIVKIKEEE